MSFSINTNVASLSAQNYLRVNSNFQNTTINRVTSGLRIVQSGDDAAGLAIANRYRSDQAVLTQGVRNANDGLSQLQIADGGMNNISQLLDRARTLATQSATGTFTGDRKVLNDEFQNVLSEIDRQAQSIGLDNGGIFAKSLSVFIGGGKANNGTSVVQNGSVSVDLTSSIVDTKGLGLKGSPAINAGSYDLSNNANTSVANLVAQDTTSNPSNTSADFYFQGPGFGDSSKVKVSVARSGLTDANSLMSAINTAIATTGGLGTLATTAFKNAGISAQIVTDSTGKQKLAFTSSNAAFQVEAGNQLANAFMGNFDSTTPALGASLVTSVKGAAALNQGNENGENINIQISGGGLISPVSLAQFAGTGSIAADINAKIAAYTNSDASIQAFVRANFTADDTGTNLVIKSKNGEQLSVAVSGDLKNALGMGNATAGAAGTTATYTSVTGGNIAAAAATDHISFNFSVGGGATATIDQTGNSYAASAAGAQALANDLNTTIHGLGAGNAIYDAGITVTAVGQALRFTSANGSMFQMGVGTANTSENAGFGTSGTAALGNVLTTTNVVASPVLDSGSVNQSAAFKFVGMQYGADSQQITVEASDATGATQTKSIALTLANADTLDHAVNTINSQLQASNNPTMMGIVALKTVDSSGNERLMLQSAKSSFTTTIGATTNGHATGLYKNTSTTSTPNWQQGLADNTTTVVGGTTLDIGTQAGAQAAVSSLAAAVTSLGSAQAVVGRGENEFNYAVNLAQSQLTNLATAESRIRDADLASEAANLTKAQVLMQAGVAALAQANSAPQSVLSLLR